MILLIGETNETEETINGSKRYVYNNFDLNLIHLPMSYSFETVTQ